MRSLDVCACTYRTERKMEKPEACAVLSLNRKQARENVFVRSAVSSQVAVVEVRTL